jgi:hypothetical protein
LRKIVLLAAIVTMVLAAAAPALAGSRDLNNSGKGNSGNHKDFAGLVDIGGDRKMYLECHGKGSPTVVFVSGGATAPKHGAKRSTHPSRQCCLRSLKPTGYAPMTVPALFSR